MPFGSQSGGAQGSGSGGAVWISHPEAQGSGVL